MDLNIKELSEINTLEAFEKKCVEYLEEHPELKREAVYEHEFADGVYIRTMKVTAGTLVIGKRHRNSTYNIFLKGKALIYAGEGQPIKEIVAPMTFVSGPLVKKMAIFLEDSEWINVHPTEETDLNFIEQQVIIPEQEYLENKGALLCLGDM